MLKLNRYARALVVGVSITIVVFMLPFGDATIQEFQDHNLAYYMINDAVLINTDQSNYLFPYVNYIYTNDNLIHEFSISNLSYENSRIDYNFTLFEENKPIDLQSGSWLLPKKMEAKKQFELPINKENIYSYSLNLIFYDRTGNKEYAKYDFSHPNIHVFSLNDKLQNDANRLTLQGLVIIGLIGAGTIMALVWNINISKEEIKKFEDHNKLLSKQNNMLKEQNDKQNKQFELSMMPQIISKPLEPKYAKYGNDAIPWDAYAVNKLKPDWRKPDEIILHISCANIGKLPAKIKESMECDILHNTGKFEKSFHDYSRPPIPLLPGEESLGFDICIPYNDSNQYLIDYKVEYSFNVFGVEKHDFRSVRWSWKDMKKTILPQL